MCSRSIARHASALILLALPTSALPQTTAKPAVRHTATATHRAPTAAKACSDADIPALSPKIPAVSPAQGCPKTLYSLHYIDTVIGTGPLAEPRKWYTVHYTGYLPDGTKFDSSVDRGEPISFPYGAHQVIAGWDTGFGGMHVGGKRRLFIPYQLAYGETGRPPKIPAKSELVFDLELISFSDEAPKPKVAPAPPAQPGSTQPQPGTTPPRPDAATSAQPRVLPVKPAADPTKPASDPTNQTSPTPPPVQTKPVDPTKPTVNPSTPPSTPPPAE